MIDSRLGVWMWRRGLPLLLACCAWPALAQRGGGASLQHDVFSRPSLAASAPARSAPIEVAAAWRPTLRAVVVAGERSQVLVERSAVELGGVVDGYRLVAVAEGRATFVRGTQRVELTMGQTRRETR